MNLETILKDVIYEYSKKPWKDRLISDEIMYATGNAISYEKISADEAKTWALEHVAPLEDKLTEADAYALLQGCLINYYDDKQYVESILSKDLDLILRWSSVYKWKPVEFAELKYRSQVIFSTAQTSLQENNISKTRLEIADVCLARIKEIYTILDKFTEYKYNDKDELMIIAEQEKSESEIDVSTIWKIYSKQKLDSKKQLSIRLEKYADEISESTMIHAIRFEKLDIKKIFDDALKYYTARKDKDTKLHNKNIKQAFNEVKKRADIFSKQYTYALCIGCIHFSNDKTLLKEFLSTDITDVEKRMYFTKILDFYLWVPDELIEMNNCRNEIYRTAVKVYDNEKVTNEQVAASLSNINKIINIKEELEKPLDYEYIAQSKINAYSYVLELEAQRDVDFIIRTSQGMDVHTHGVVSQALLQRINNIKYDLQTTIHNWALQPS